MSDANSVGSVFRERREQLGIPLDVAAGKTNIRARMLETLESGDYGTYPPHGHAIGMLSSYARYLGMEPRPLIERFESEYAAFQTGEKIYQSASRTRKGLGRYGERVNGSDRPVTRETSRSLRNRRGLDDSQAANAQMAAKFAQEQVAEGDDRYKSGSVKVVGTRATGSFGRVSSSRHPSASASASGRIPRASQEASQRPLGQGQGVASGIPDEGDPQEQGRYAGHEGSRGRSYARRHRTRGARTASGGTHAVGRRQRDDGHRSQNAAQRGELDRAQGAGGAHEPHRHATRRSARERAALKQDAGKGIIARVGNIVTAAFSEPRTRLIILAAAAIIVAVVIAASLLIGSAGSGNGSVIQASGGIEDQSTAKQDSSTATTTVTTTNGSPITVKISVAENSTSLVDVKYDGDKAYYGTAVGPWECTFYVTESLSATFGNPDAVAVTENGKAVEVSKTDDGQGIFNLKISSTSSVTTTSTSKKESSGK